MLKRFERFLSHLEWCGNVGHSAIVAMSIDGDGRDRLSVSPKLSKEGSEAIAKVGADIECASDVGMYAVFEDRQRKTFYRSDGPHLFRAEAGGLWELVK